MSQKQLKNNAELYQFLCKLAQELQDAGHNEFAEKVEAASLFANGSASEFLHESQLALELVDRANPVQIDTSKIRLVISQIKEAFRKVGGA